VVFPDPSGGGQEARRFSIRHGRRIEKSRYQSWLRFALSGKSAFFCLLFFPRAKKSRSRVSANAFDLCFAKDRLEPTIELVVFPDRHVREGQHLKKN
jgi:hypothetical protein